MSNIQEVISATSSSGTFALVSAFAASISSPMGTDVSAEYIHSSGPSSSTEPHLGPSSTPIDVDNKANLPKEDEILDPGPELETEHKVISVYSDDSDPNADPPPLGPKDGDT